jgi:lipocalin
MRSLHLTAAPLLMAVAINQVYPLSGDVEKEHLERYYGLWSKICRFEKDVSM